MKTQIQEKSESQESVHDETFLIKWRLSFFCPFFLFLFKYHLNCNTPKVPWENNLALQVSCLPERSFRNSVLLVRGFCRFIGNIWYLRTGWWLRLANTELLKIHLSYLCNTVLPLNCWKGLQQGCGTSLLQISPKFPDMNQGPFPNGNLLRGPSAWELCSMNTDWF